MTTVVLLGTLDTKGREYAFVRGRLLDAGVDVVLVNVGIVGEPAVTPDISAAEVAASAGVTLAELRGAGERDNARAEALSAMQAGATTIATRLLSEDRCDGILALGGSGGTELCTGVMRALPFGLPKVMVSTMASGDVAAYVGSSDLCMVHSVTDIAGLNRISRRVLTNAAAAVAGMARENAVVGADTNDKRAVGISMLGVTTPAVLRVVTGLERAGYEPVVFHAVGSGGRAMEQLLDDGVLDAVVDFTPKEVTDELFGGVFAVGPQRLRTAGRRGLTQLMVPGAAEVINFGPLDTVPPRLRDRPTIQHNTQVTAVRITREEAARVGQEFADRLNEATGPTAVVVPLRGFDSYDVPGGPFEDPESDRALVDALVAALRPGIEVTLLDTHANDPAFADAVVRAFVTLDGNGRTGGNS